LFAKKKRSHRNEEHFGCLYTCRSGRPDGLRNNVTWSGGARRLDGVVKNGTVDTRIGELSFENGYPSRESVEHLFEAMDFQRACQAYIWSLPIVAMDAWQRSHKEVFKVDDGDIVVYTSTEQKLGILTANATTPYIPE
jgi:hypothetical protein